MKLPAALVSAIRDGHTVLLLGAGAVVGAARVGGGVPPDTTELRDLIGERFLAPELRNRSLSTVADLAASQAGRGEVQDFIRTLLLDLEPAPFHGLLPSFRWRGIATTNYDLLIETVYAGSGDRAQELVPIYSDSDKIDSVLRSSDSLPFLKLHGCISRTRDDRLPLILTPEQYYTHRVNRSNLFKTLTQWGTEYPLIYIGHSMQDLDIRGVLLEASQQPDMRALHYLVLPDVHEIEVSYWMQKRVQVLDGTFEDFLTELSEEVPPTHRKLARLVPRESPIENYFASRTPPSDRLRHTLEYDLEHVHQGLVLEAGEPNQFYRGFPLGWLPVVRDWDVRRRLGDTLMLDVILRAENERVGSTELHVVKAEAGAGKSVVLRRLAWDAATQAEVPTLYLRPHATLSVEPLLELAELIKTRFFLFVDDAADRVVELRQAVVRLRKREAKVTILTAERTSTWNSECDELEALITDEHELLRLSRDEIKVLVELLAKHHSLGGRLERLSPLERVKEFEDPPGADRQLLVALHEATAGRPLEDILVDEYNEVQPPLARQLYLSVCILSRLRVRVRAGIIARLYGIAFEDFRQKFFRPLEHVVYASTDRATGDFYYAARHPEIAEIVFERILDKSEDRFHEVARLLPELNLAYSADEKAFRLIMRARSLDELFPSREDVEALFALSDPGAGSAKAFLFQQRAIYEMIRSDGSLRKAEDLLRIAQEASPNDESITHSRAELHRQLAQAAGTRLSRERHRNEASALLTPLLSRSQHEDHARHTLVKLAVDGLRDLLRDPDCSDRAIDGAVRALEGTLFRYLQQNPADPYLLAAEANLSEILRDDARALQALEAASRSNPRDPYIASRLASVYEAKGDLARAAETLRVALSSKRGDKPLNYRYADIQRRQGTLDRRALANLFKRGFTVGDKNYNAQFWFARFAYNGADADERRAAAEVFGRLRDIAMPRKARVQIRDTEVDADGPVIYWGTVASLEGEFGFVRRDGLGDRVFFHRSKQDPAVWSRLRVGMRIRFQLSYSFKGPEATDIVP